MSLEMTDVMNSSFFIFLARPFLLVLKYGFWAYFSDLGHLEVTALTTFTKNVNLKSYRQGLS